MSAVNNIHQVIYAALPVISPKKQRRLKIAFIIIFFIENLNMHYMKFTEGLHCHEPIISGLNLQIHKVPHNKQAP